MNYSCIILAAGFGRRLKHLTENLPKALVQVNNKCLIDYHLDSIGNFGFTDIVITTFYLSNLIIKCRTQKDRHVIHQNMLSIALT
jgi:choline kinase